MTTPPGGGSAPAASLIDLRGIGVRYPGAAAAALADVHLSVGHGEFVTITGPAGSGKSTLLRVIGMLLRPTAGSYLFNGLDTAALGDRERAAFRCRLIGCVFQRRHLLRSRSALDNVMLPALYSGLPRQRRRLAALDALDRVGLAGAARVAAGDLTAGEQQRAAIARAIVAEPSLLLCDDPTASLDDAAAALVIGLLVDLHRDGRTVLLVTRDQLAAAQSSRTVDVGAHTHGVGR